MQDRLFNFARRSTDFHICAQRTLALPNASRCLLLFPILVVRAYDAPHIAEG